MVEVKLSQVRELEPFSFRWPDAPEQFESGWEAEATIAGETHRLRYGVGGRPVYGRQRLHTVTWLDGDVQVEGVEADDYPTTLALLSRIRRPGRSVARQWKEVPAGYEGFLIVEHRREIDAPYSPTCLAVKIGEDDLESWAVHAWLRSRLPRSAAAPEAPPAAVPGPREPTLPPPGPGGEAVARALLDHGGTLAAQLGGGGTQFTPDARADRLVREDPFCFLVAVIADMGVRAERAWALPFELSQRLGGLDPSGVASDPDAVRRAIQRPPKLHRFANLVPEWIVSGARLVLERYAGHAEGLWDDGPTVVELRDRLEAFPGIGQKKAAMAAEILARDLGKPIRDLEGGDVAYDVHLRRVFLRSGLVTRDEVQEMVQAARALHPSRPGALDLPAWDIGRRWCHPRHPDCPTCPLNHACPRLIDLGSKVRGA